MIAVLDSPWMEGFLESVYVKFLDIFFPIFFFFIDNQNMWERSNDNLGNYCYGKFVLNSVWVLLFFFSSFAISLLFIR